MANIGMMMGCGKFTERSEAVSVTTMVAYSFGSPVLALDNTTTPTDANIKFTHCNLRR